VTIGTVDSIKEDEAKDIDLTNNESFVNGLTLTVHKDLTYVKISCSLLNDRPYDLEAPAEMVYRYLEFEANIDDVDIKDLIISFHLDKEWFTTHMIDEDTVTLYRYHDSQWQQVPTNRTHYDDSYVYYEAVTKGLSTFAITGEQIVTSPGPTGAPIWIIALLIITILIILFFILLKKGYIYFEHEEE